MPKDKPLKYHTLLKKLKRFGVVEMPSRRKKGSRRMLYHSEMCQSYPIHSHSMGHEVNREVVRAVRSRFDISAEEFYKR